GQAGGIVDGGDGGAPAPQLLAGRLDTRRQRRAGLADVPALPPLSVEAAQRGAQAVAVLQQAVVDGAVKGLKGVGHGIDSGSGSGLNLVWTVARGRGSAAQLHEQRAGIVTGLGNVED